jgi:hypothetical protein
MVGEMSSKSQNAGSAAVSNQRFFRTHKPKARASTPLKTTASGLSHLPYRSGNMHATPTIAIAVMQVMLLVAAKSGPHLYETYAVPAATIAVKISKWRVVN